MKIIFTVLFIVAYTYSARSQEVKTDSIITATIQEITEGKRLLLRSGCSACHSPQTKMVGPSYIDISKKYLITEVNISLLAQKVIRGGSGVWGQVPMPPHSVISRSDTKKIIKYILSEY